MTEKSFKDQLSEINNGEKSFFKQSRSIKIIRFQKHPAVKDMRPKLPLFLPESYPDKFTGGSAVLL